MKTNKILNNFNHCNSKIAIFTFKEWLLKPCFQMELECTVVGFCGGSKPVNWRKTLGSTQLNPYVTSKLGFETRPHWWEASAPTTDVTLSPDLHCSLSVLLVISVLLANYLNSSVSVEGLSTDSYFAKIMFLCLKKLILSVEALYSGLRR